MSRTDKKMFWVGFLLGAGVTLVATLVPPTKPGIAIVCLISWLCFVVAAYQLGWAERAPHWIGRPVRALLLYGLITAIMITIGWWRWPERQITVKVIFADRS